MDRTEYGDTLSVSQSEPEQSGVMQPGRKKAIVRYATTGKMVYIIP